MQLVREFFFLSERLLSSAVAETACQRIDSSQAISKNFPALFQVLRAIVECTFGFEGCLCLQCLKTDPRTTRCWYFFSVRSFGQSCCHRLVHAMISLEPRVRKLNQPKRGRFVVARRQTFENVSW